MCSTWVSSTKIAIDHIDPVVPPEGFPSNADMWQRIMIFLKRLWCDKSNLQRVCSDCHDKKTYSERISRLLKQYGGELDLLEYEIDKVMKTDDFKKDSKPYIKGWNKELSKYLAKKKTPELISVVERAQALKNKFKKE